MKPLGYKAYGSIPHLIGSRMGPSDHHCHEGQVRICTEKVRDKNDLVIVQEKLDGSCCAVARLEDGRLAPIGRAGHLAESSPYPQHVMFSKWVHRNSELFHFVRNGERAVGEWLAQAHSTIYDLPHLPFVVFDVMRGLSRITYKDLSNRLIGSMLPMPRLLHIGGAYSINEALEAIKISGHGAIDPVEGAVWRVEREGRVDFLTKYVRPEKVDGIYLPTISGLPEVWNWREPIRES